MSLEPNHSYCNCATTVIACVSRNISHLFCVSGPIPHPLHILDCKSAIIQNIPNTHNQQNHTTLLSPYKKHLELFSGHRRRGQILHQLLALHGAEPAIALIEDGIDALEKGVAEDIHGHIAATLDAAVEHTIAGVGEAEVFLLDREEVVADSEGDGREIRLGGVGGEEVALGGSVIGGAGDGGVDGFTGYVVDEGEGGAGVCDGGVVGAAEGLAVDGGGGAGELPEALGGVDGGVGDGGAGGGDGRLVDEAEGVEAFALVGLGGVAPAAEFGGEELGAGGDVGLRDHVLDGGLYWGGLDGVDVAEGESE